jgi:RNA polymerase sigma factor (sigma-70 family)
MIMINQKLTFEAFYQSNFQNVANFLKSKCNCYESAQDLTQDCFVKFYQNIEKVESGKETSYLYTIANNLFIDLKRKDKVKLKYINSNGYLYEACSESPEAIMRGKEFQVKLDNKLNSLPPLCAQILTLNKIEKKTYAEIATIIGLSVKSVEKKMSVALKTYREIRKSAC